jgi:hypothetical protein
MLQVELLARAVQAAQAVQVVAVQVVAVQVVVVVQVVAARAVVVQVVAVQVVAAPVEPEARAQPEPVSSTLASTQPTIPRWAMSTGCRCRPP